MVEGSDFYAILGVPRDASPDEIRNAYFEAARRYHPDANPDPIARELFLGIQNAYEVLSNPEKRAAFDATLPPPPPQPQISINVKYSRAVLPKTEEPQLAYALVEMVYTGPQDSAQYPPQHICLVLDRSTSMLGERIDMVKNNVTNFLRQLRPQDMVSVVIFSDRADCLIPLSHLTDPVKIASKISMINPGGGTEIFQGLQAGVEQLMSLRGLNAVRQLILLTDGHTYGDEADCLSLAERAAHEGITISALGIGSEWNDKFLDQITSLSGGSAFFIKNSRDLAKFLDQKMAAATAIYGRGVTYEFTSPPSCQLRYAFKLSPEVGPLPVASSILIGDLPFGTPLTFLLEFYISDLPVNLEEIILADGRLRMEIVSQSENKSRFFLSLARPLAAEPEPELPPSAVMDALSRLSMYRLQERASQDVESGDVAQASRRLQYLATHLLSIGDRELARTVLVEAENIQQSHHFSEDGDKRIKYGTRALLLPPGVQGV